MTSPDSWIDQDEIDQLVGSLGGAQKKSEPAEEPEGEEAAAEEEAENPNLEPTEEAKSNLVRALTEARNRANRGGLLKKWFTSEKGSVWPDFPPLESEKSPLPDEAESEVMPEPEPENPELPDLTKPLRQRLENFGKETVEKFNAEVFALTDFSGYPLFCHGEKSDVAIAAAAHVTDQVDRLSETVGAPKLGSTQISLADDRWLCLVEAKSAAGGVLAHLQIPEPMDSGTTTTFRDRLEIVLAGESS